MSETCERCYRELEPGDEKFCKWCRRYNVVSDEAWLLRRQLAAVTAERDAARAALWDARNEVVEFNSKRVQFRYDRPASEAQLAYVRDLLARAKRYGQEIDTNLYEGGEYAREFWRLAELPPDLTAFEAGGLISYLRNIHSDYSAAGVIHDVSYALTGPRRDTNYLLGLLALEEAVAYVMSLVEEMQ